jgi:hypothetical protein
LSAQISRYPFAAIDVPLGIRQRVGSLASSVRYIPPTLTGTAAGLCSSIQSSCSPCGSVAPCPFEARNSFRTTDDAAGAETASVNTTSTAIAKDLTLSTMFAPNS